MRARHVFTALFSPLLVGCGAILPVEIDPEITPRGLWDTYEIVSSDFQLKSPVHTSNYFSRREPADCPGTGVSRRPYGTPAEKAVCRETRVRDTTRNCDIVFSTFGYGYCPASSQNELAMQKMEAVVAVGTAAQNAVLRWGQKKSREAQIKGKEFLDQHAFSLEKGSYAGTALGEKVTELVPLKSGLVKPGARLAQSRRGFYSQCLIPRFGSVGLASIGKLYYRIAKDKPLCKVPLQNDYYSADYMNIKSGDKPGASFVGQIRIKKKDDEVEFCIGQDMGFGFTCAFKKTVSSGEVLELTGFVEDKQFNPGFILLSAIESNSIILSAENITAEKQDRYSLSQAAPQLAIQGLNLRLLDNRYPNLADISLSLADTEPQLTSSQISFGDRGKLRQPSDGVSETKVAHGREPQINPPEIMITPRETRALSVAKVEKSSVGYASERPALQSDADSTTNLLQVKSDKGHPVVSLIQTGCRVQSVSISPSDNEVWKLFCLKKGQVELVHRSTMTSMRN